jgi:NAD-dependent dihydropyrimidine dehydrogenase PreA subunit
MIRKIVQIDAEKCNGCGLCVPSCAEGAIRIVNGKAVLAADNLCDGLGACLGDCPQDAIRVIEREADEFDEAAVEEHLKEIGHPAPAHQGHHGHGHHHGHHHGHDGQGYGHGHHHGGGCPGSMARVIERSEPAVTATEKAPSELQQWPVQLHLVPPSAPYFRNAHVLVAADCVAFALGSFHRDLLKGKALAIACPKLDDTGSYVEKLTAIFRDNDVQSVTVAIMEVPCCRGLDVMVRQALAASGREIPFSQVTVTIGGEIRE